MKLISWNVNGIRACLQKDFLQFFHNANADVFCLQETKVQEGQVELPLEGYHQFWNYAEKKGYSGTALFSKQKPISVTYGVGVPHLDKEGRVITAEFAHCYVVTCYTPNAQDGLKRIDHRMEWDDAFRAHLLSLDAKKPVLACGDLNVAHEEIDLRNPKSNRGNAGFSDQERAKFTELLDAGFADSFRYRNPDVTGAYSWWSYRFSARSKNTGWRIDYFVASDRIKDAISAAPIYQEIHGSDHCPVGITFEEDF
ncbi:MAG: exodeoxyribonuclease III [Eubacteriales bacterium]